ncbi:MAG: hypothetical protein WAO00_15230 [Chthoniobacterales bacterium]
MQKRATSESGVFNPRIFIAFILCFMGASLAMFSLAGPAPSRITGVAAPTVTPTFGNPVIAGIGGSGFEVDVRVDPSDSNRIYMSAPGALSSDTSWIWRSLDAGKTFKWVPNGAPLTGKVTTCHGGGDTELGVDSAGHLYFNDLTLANFSTGRSDDQGVSFTCSNTGVPDTAVDRQWYTIDGDPTNGGSIYLANDEIGPGGVMCGNSTGNNVLVMYRSPIGGVGATAGITFGPANHVSAVGSCDEAIMGNNELSPVATTLGQPDGLGGFATLPAPVKHVFVIHDNAQLNKILIGRCFPVPFGAPIPNVSDPSGLNCVDLPVADLGANVKVGANFPSMAIDKAGNLYAVWNQAPINAGGQVTGDTVIMYTYSTNQGNTWATPIQINTSGSPFGVLHTNVMVWAVAGDDGRVDIAWYGTPGQPTHPSTGPDSCGTNCDWSLWMAQTLNGHAASPTFTAPIQASQHFNHRGSMNTLIGGQAGDRTLGDFIQIRLGPQGEARISYSDSNNIDESLVPHGMFVQQNGGDSLFVANSPVNIPGLAPFNAVTDPTGDAKYEVSGTSSASMPQLDIIGSNMSEVTTAPCSAAAPCYKVVMQLNNLSLAPSASDPDPDLVWSTQWFVPSTSDPTGGKNFHVYAESLNGAALQCFVGENAIMLLGGGAALTYPGSTQLPAANCTSTLGANGNITIYVPKSMVVETNPIDTKLHEVTASTMTLQEAANTVPPFGGIGGSFFNLIDVAQGYIFDPAGPPPTPTPTPIVTATPTSTPGTPTATPTSTVAPSVTPTATIPPTATPTVTATVPPTATPTATATVAPSATPTATATVVPTATPTATATIAPTATPSATPVPTPTDLELVNISGRVVTQPGDRVGIGGFIVKGPGFKRFIARALGPSIRINGQPVPGTLQDPILELHDSNGNTLTNDNWRSSQQTEIQASGLAPADDRESAIIRTVPAGNYTAIIRGSGGQSGIGLIEIYDLGQVAAVEHENMGPEGPEGFTTELGNLSVRADVGTDDNVLIDGIILRGGNPKRVLFRSLGPSISSNGVLVDGTLQDPILELHDANGALIRTNDDWRDATNASEIQTTGLAPPNDREPAILLTLSAGNYTTIVRGVNRTTGIGLSEAYKLDN